MKEAFANGFMHEAPRKAGNNLYYAKGAKNTSFTGFTFFIHS
jgi:hypothetical protein